MIGNDDVALFKAAGDSWFQALELLRCCGLQQVQVDGVAQPGSTQEDDRLEMVSAEESNAVCYCMAPEPCGCQLDN